MRPPFLPEGVCGLFLLLILATAAVAQESAVSPRPELRDVDFEGNEAIPGDSLRLAIVNRETECRNFLFEFLVPLCPLGLGLVLDHQQLQPREIDRDIARLEIYYWQRGYREASVDTTLTSLSPDQVRLTFHIDEGRPVLVDTIMFTGDTLPTEARGPVPLRQGDPLSYVRMRATRDSLERRLQNSGYAHALVLRNIDIDQEEYRAEVEYDIFTGPLARFGEIEVEWETEDHSLSAESVRRFLPFGTGDVYSREAILEAQRSLFSVELIRSASVQADLESQPDSVVPVSVRVNEGDVHRVRTGVGWSTADCLNSEARWTSRNFMGGARRLTVLGRLSNVMAREIPGCKAGDSGVADEFADLNWLGSIELRQPWIFGTRNSLSLSLTGERTSLPDVFIRQALGVNLSLTRSLGSRTPATISYRPQLSALEAAEVFFCTSFLVCEPSDIEVLQGANLLSPVGLTVTRDRTDNLLNPSDGYQLVLDLEHASEATFSDFEYNRVVGEVNWYTELARRTVLAARLRAGWIGSGRFDDPGLREAVEVVHPQKRFYAGGANSVRGYPQNRLGPRVLTTDVGNLLGAPTGEGDAGPVCTPEQVVTLTCDPGDALDRGAYFPRPTGGTRLLEGNLEYRFAFRGGEFQGVVFADVGQVWREREPFALGDLAFSPGVGVRYFSPIGPLRLDVGYRFRGRQELEVVTSQIRPFVPDEDDEARRICVLGDVPGGEITDDCGGDRVAIPWIRQDELAVLQNRVPYGSGAFLRSIQLHFSIGQAF